MKLVSPWGSRMQAESLGNAELKTQLDQFLHTPDTGQDL